MTFRLYIFLYTTALHLAIKEENMEMIRLLLSVPEINVNTKSIF